MFSAVTLVFLTTECEEASVSTRGSEYFTSEDAEAFSVFSVSSLCSLWLLYSFSAKDAEAFSVFSLVLSNNLL